MGLEGATVPGPVDGIPGVVVVGGIGGCSPPPPNIFSMKSQPAKVKAKIVNTDKISNVVFFIILLPF
jgi:hypothetical protein